MRNAEGLKKIRGILRLNFIAFPFLWTIVMLFIGLESATYPGFIRRNFFFDLKLLLILVILSGFFARSSLLSNTKIKKFYEYYRFLAIINKVCFPAFLTLLLILLSIEAKHFRGYIYTRFLHLDPYILILALGLSFFLLLLQFDVSITPSLTVRKIPRTKKESMLLKTLSMAKDTISTGFLLGILIWILIVNLFNFTRLSGPVILKIMKNPLASYDWKMKESVGSFYTYTQFINANTPQDALILHPKQSSEWPVIGNEGYTRYFVYPRDLVSVDGDEEKKKMATHIFIVGRKGLDGKGEDNQWPKESISAKRLIYMPLFGEDNPIILEKDYDPKDEINDRWGVIELER